MTQEFTRRKLHHFFTLLDQDGSRTLELADYLRAARDLAGEFGCPLDSAPHCRLRDRFAYHWETVIKPADTDGDGHVSFEQYFTAFEARVLTSPEGFERIRPMSEAILEIAGVRRQGMLSAEEFAQMMRSAFNVPTRESTATFVVLDEDRSGALSLDDLQQAVEEFFLGTDPAAPGNGLFGRITA